MGNLTFFDIQVIQCYLDTKSPEFIAMILDKPVDVIKSEIYQLLIGDKSRKSFNKLQREQQLLLINRERFKEQDKLLFARKKKKEPVEILPDKFRDYSEMVSVRIDSKTVILVESGSDIEKVKQSFLKKRPPLPWQIPKNPWKKFKPGK